LFNARLHQRAPTRALIMALDPRCHHGVGGRVMVPRETISASRQELLKHAPKIR
jgi:hypothetical protein